MISTKLWNESLIENERLVLLPLSKLWLHLTTVNTSIQRYPLLSFLDSSLDVRFLIMLIILDNLDHILRLLFHLLYVDLVVLKFRVFFHSCLFMLLDIFLDFGRLLQQSLVPAFSLLHLNFQLPPLLLLHLLL